MKRSAAAGAVVGFPTIIPSTVLGQNGNVAPSNRAAIGLIACGSRASYAGMYQRYEKSEIVAVADPRKKRRDAFSAKFNNCEAYNDFRELLARKDIDGVHIATPDHWHVPIALLAAKAGKDIYAEKPLGHSIDQDLKARAIVDKYKRVFQYGAQQRSQTHVRMGIELALNGHIGDVKELYVWAPNGRSGGNKTPAPVPEGFDYDMWLGPAPEAPFYPDRVTGNGVWHIYDYAIGFIAGWGAHPMDMLQWWADNQGKMDIPVKYEGTGAWKPDDLYNTVTSWDVNCTYANGIPMRFMDTRKANSAKPHPGVAGGHGTLLVGTEGWVRVSRDGWMTSSEELRQKAKNPGEKRLKVSRDQIQNFVDCILTREEPVDNLHSAVRSDVATHLSEIAIRTGKVIEWDKKKERIKDKEDRKRMKRTMRKQWAI
ncbi:MAG: Gfo/Idh/MocA family oxidoreductase [Kiritimatiellae bacterium]|nr:Gfo/Idh/MocA family oxidoreductase [Kiritimatiellia bacterium]